MTIQRTLVVVLALGVMSAVAVPSYAGNEAEATVTYY